MTIKLISLCYTHDLLRWNRELHYRTKTQACLEQVIGCESRYRVSLEVPHSSRRVQHWALQIEQIPLQMVRRGQRRC